FVASVSFFFQAEDGIRDRNVTGVQTCALPICWALSEEYHTNEGGHIRIYTRAELEAKLKATGFTIGPHHHAHALHAPYWWIKCAVGTDNNEHPLAKAYHELLVWDMLKAPAVTRTAEKLLNPIIGKSVVVYVRKPITAD